MLLEQKFKKKSCLCSNNTRRLCFLSVNHTQFPLDYIRHGAIERENWQIHVKFFLRVNNSFSTQKREKYNFTLAPTQFAEISLQTLASVNVVSNLRFDPQLTLLPDDTIGKFIRCWRLIMSRLSTSLSLVNDLDLIQPYIVCFRRRHRSMLGKISQLKFVHVLAGCCCRVAS